MSDPVDRAEQTYEVRDVVGTAVFLATVGTDQDSALETLQAADWDVELLKEARGRIVAGLHRNPTIDVVGIRAARLLDAAVMAVEPHRAA